MLLSNPGYLPLFFPSVWSLRLAYGLESMTFPDNLWIRRGAFLSLERVEAASLGAVGSALEPSQIKRYLV